MSTVKSVDIKSTNEQASGVTVPNSGSIKQYEADDEASSEDEYVPYVAGEITSDGKNHCNFGIL